MTPKNRVIPKTSPTGPPDHGGLSLLAQPVGWLSQPPIRLESVRDSQPYSGFTINTAAYVGVHENESRVHHPLADYHANGLSQVKELAQRARSIARRELAMEQEQEEEGKMQTSELFQACSLKPFAR